MTAPRSKSVANGQCGICRGTVPAQNTNKFYCSETCRREAFSFHHAQCSSCRASYHRIDGHDCPNNREDY